MRYVYTFRNVLRGLILVHPVVEPTLSAVGEVGEVAQVHQVLHCNQSSCDDVQV